MDESRATISSRAFWAKLSEDLASFHPLFAHCADVAAVLERLIAPGTPLAARLAAALGMTELHPRHRAILIYLAALHDIGKSNHGFQERAYTQPRFRRCGHVKVLLESLGCPPLRDAVRDLLAPLGLAKADALALLQTTIAHHGRPWEVQATAARHALWLPASGIPRDPVAEIRRIGTLAPGWSGLTQAPDAPPLAVTPAFTHLYAGALTLADWLGSNEQVFEFAPDADPDTYWQTARERAADICARTGVTGREVALAECGAPLLRRLFPGVFARPEQDRHPTPLQEHAATMPLPPPGTRLLVESETGSGKTEAALALYARLRAAGLVGGLVFALPTRATSAAMYERVLNALPGIYGDALPSVALAVGGTQPRTSSTAPELETEPLRYEEGEDGGDPLARWATEDARRYLAAEIVVGTLDQLLLGALPVRHAHLRLASLTRHLLVVDELHSYDRYMTHVLRRLLGLHTAHGGFALFMSATLSDEARRELGGTGEPKTTRAEAKERPYPSLSACVPGGNWTDESLPSSAQPKPVHWACLTGDEWIAPAAEAARGGARVLVLRNTVKAARASVEALRAAGHAALLWSPRTGATPAYHSRYAPADRLALDEDAIRRFGRGGSGEGVILVATQVAEQSLDVDFDLLVTDLCPVDVLLQRIGRLWRHPERVRPSVCSGARVWVLVPAEGLERYRDSKSGQGPDGWGTVYPDLGDLALTHDLVKARPDILIPRDNRELVEAVYHPDSREALGEDPSWQAYLDQQDGKDFAIDNQGKTTALRFDETYPACAKQYDAERERKVRTRLGDDRVRVGLSQPAACRYAVGKKVDFVELPADVVLASGVGLESPQAVAVSEDEDRFHLGDYEIAYGDGGWVWGKRGEPEGA